MYRFLDCWLLTFDSRLLTALVAFFAPNSVRLESRCNAVVLNAVRNPAPQRYRSGTSQTQCFVRVRELLLQTPQHALLDRPLPSTLLCVRCVQTSIRSRV